MANCYDPQAEFHDIAFHLQGRDHVRSMWQMICRGDIRVTFDITHADEHEGRAKLVDEYTFAETGRHVRNPIESNFRFRDGRILEQRDVCDARAWAAMAIGGVSGWVAGRVGFLRTRKAHRMLRRFIAERERIQSAPQARAGHS
jgi:hypothetical protein